MAKLPKLPSMLHLAKTALLIFVLFITLSGCALQRAESQTETSETSSGLPPTLAPLGSNSSDFEGDAAATAVNVQATATNSTLGAGAATEDGEQTLPTTQPVDLSSEEATTESLEQAVVEPESFVPPTAEEASVSGPIIVSAVTEEELPSGGPIATNPPVSDTTGNYTIDTPSVAAPAYDNGQGYRVQVGDTLFGLSLAYDTTVSKIMLLNDLTSETIYEGQTIVIPGYGGYNAVGPTQNGTHLVATGETLFSIALDHNTTVEALAAANNLSSPYMIYAGQTLYITGGYDNTYAVPTNGSVGIHTVAPGETLYFIAQRYGITTQALVAANGLLNPNQIQSGEILIIPQ